MDIIKSLRSSYHRSCYKKIPLNRLVANDEYNEVIVWMFSDSSSYYKVTIINDDDGRTA